MIINKLNRRSGAALVLGLAGLVALPNLAFADNVKNDVISDTGVGGTRRVETDQQTTVNYYVQPTGGTCDAADGSAVTVTINAPAAVTKSVSALVFTTCNVEQSVTFSSATAGAYDITHTANDAKGSYNTSPATFTLEVSAPVVVTPPNAAPTVATAAADATGNEGSALSTSGSFDDDGGAGNLAIKQVAGDGTVTAGANGSWSWSHTPNDNLGGTVEVLATDDQGLTVTDSFTWTSDNVAPVIGAVQLTRTGACAVGLSASFTDAGSADTHNGVISWGDASSSDPAGDETSPVTGSHTYAAAGTYTASVTVTDDDGGTASKSAAGGFAAYNTPSAILQPINSSGTRSGFKIGSTIPVKITVTGCDGGAVSNLAPQVNLVQGDTTPDVSVNEAVVSEVATNGKQMRWDATGSLYIYNLSTKLSQFTGGQLTQGTFTVSVSDPSFASPVKAAFDLRK